MTSTAVKITSKGVEVNFDSLTLRKLEGLVYYKKHPFTGTSVTYNSAGTKIKTIDYADGKREGSYLMRFDDGSLSYQAQYSDGQQHGETKTWWRNGNLRSQSYFVNGIAEGEQLQWYKSGAKFKSMNMTNGREEGMQKSWRENGKVYNNYEALNGRIFGLKRAALCFQLDNENVVYEKE